MNESQRDTEEMRWIPKPGPTGWNVVTDELKDRHLAGPFRDMPADPTGRLTAQAICDGHNARLDRTGPAPYGYCPFCGAAGKTRERRPDGNDRCEAGHTYPSARAVAWPRASELRRRKSTTYAEDHPTRMGGALENIMEIGNCLGTVEEAGDLAMAREAARRAVPHLRQLEADAKQLAAALAKWTEGMAVRRRRLPGTMAVDACPSCGSVGFAPSAVYRFKCEFCDGTVGGHKPQGGTR